MHGPFLWRIENLETSWLFGTLHYPDARLLRVPEPVEIALDACHVLYAERKLSLWRLAAEGLWLAVAGGTDLAKALGPGLFARLAAHVESHGASIRRFKNVKPWVVLVLLPELWRSDASKTRRVLDQHLWIQAGKRRKTRRGLETFRGVVQRFDRLSLDDQRRMLSGTLDAYDRFSAAGHDILEEAILAYLSGSQERLLDVMYAAFGATEDVRERFFRLFLTGRNRAWVATLGRQLRDRPDRSLLIAAGALHMLGPDNVPDLLRAEGFTVRRV